MEALGEALVEGSRALRGDQGSWANCGDCQEADYSWPSYGRQWWHSCYTIPDFKTLPVSDWQHFPSNPTYLWAANFQAVSGVLSDLAISCAVYLPPVTCSRAPHWSTQRLKPHSVPRVVLHSFIALWRDEYFLNWRYRAPRFWKFFTRYYSCFGNCILVMILRNFTERSPGRLVTEDWTWLQGSMSASVCCHLCASKSHMTSRFAEVWLQRQRETLVVLLHGMAHARNTEHPAVSTLTSLYQQAVVITTKWGASSQWKLCTLPVQRYSDGTPV